MTQTHFFLAIPIKEEIKNGLKNSVDELKEELQFKNWVHPDDYHITLAFLGNSPLESLDKVKKELPTVLKRHHPFNISLTDYNFFGQSKRPRIFWRGVSDSDPLYQLQEDIFKTCEVIGYELDKKKFRPHITLARKWNSEEDYEHNIKREIEADEKDHWLVNEVVLYQTHLKQTPKYEKKEIFKIGD